MAATVGRARREERGGCSGDWPARKVVADFERMRRMERVGLRAEREEMMRGSFMVATEPVAARRRWGFVSLREEARRVAGDGWGFGEGDWGGGLGVVAISDTCADRRFMTIGSLFAPEMSFRCLELLFLGLSKKQVYYRVELLIKAT